MSDLLEKLTLSKTIQLNPTPNTQSQSDAKFSFFASSKCFSKDQFIAFLSNRNLLTKFYLFSYQLVLDLFILTRNGNIVWKHGPDCPFYALMLKTKLY